MSDYDFERYVGQPLFDVADMLDFATYAVNLSIEAGSGAQVARHISDSLELRLRRAQERLSVNPIAQQP